MALLCEFIFPSEIYSNVLELVVALLFLSINFIHFCYTGLIKFFGNVAQKRPQETFRDYPKVIEMIFNTVKESDQSLVCVALETVGYIATTPKGKQMLQKQGYLNSISF